MHIDHHTHFTHTTQCAQNTRIKWINESASVEVVFFTLHCLDMLIM